MFRCSTCREITKQYVNGKIAYLPIDDPHVLENEPQSLGATVTFMLKLKLTAQRPGRHSKRPNKNSPH